MKTESIVYLLQACEYGSISKAAYKNNISSQGMGKAIQALECEIGTELLVKSNTGVRMTEFGVEIYPHLKNIEKELQFIKKASEIASDRRRKNKLRMLIAYNELGDIIPGCIEQYNAMGLQQIELVVYDKDETELEEIFLTESFHYRICTKQLCRKTTNNPFGCLYRMQFYPVVQASSQLAQRSSVDFSDLTELEVLCEKTKLQYVRFLYEKTLGSVDKRIKFTPISGRWSLMRILEKKSNCVYFSTGSTFSYIEQNPHLSFLKMKNNVSIDIGLQSNFLSIDPMLYQCIQTGMRQALSENQ